MDSGTDTWCPLYMRRCLWFLAKGWQLFTAFPTAHRSRHYDVHYIAATAVKCTTGLPYLLTKDVRQTHTSTLVVYVYHNSSFFYIVCLEARTGGA